MTANPWNGLPAQPERDGWPDPGRIGVPRDPDRAGWHLLRFPLMDDIAVLWIPQRGFAPSGHWTCPMGLIWRLSDGPRACNYLGPIYSEAELAAREAAAAGEAREAALRQVGVMRGRANGPGQEQRKRALGQVEDAIRALHIDPTGALSRALAAEREAGRREEREAIARRHDERAREFQQQASYFNGPGRLTHCAGVGGAEIAAADYRRLAEHNEQLAAAIRARGEGGV